MNELKPLMFLEGDWHGTGQGPYGPYGSETHVESRGRWMLITYQISQPDTGEITYVSTQVFGFDDKGLTLDLYDTAGAFRFRSVPSDKDIRFEWKAGDEWKRSTFRQEGEKIHFKYDSMEPSVSAEALIFEGEWISGKSPSKAKSQTSV